MKRRSFLLASASTVLALPVLAACGSSGSGSSDGSSASGGASAGAGSSASGSTEQSDGVPVAFDEKTSGGSTLFVSIAGDGGNYTTHCHFNDSVIGGPLDVDTAKNVPHGLAAGCISPTTKKMRVLTFDPESQKYATVEVSSDKPGTPTEAPTGEVSAAALTGMVVDKEFGYALIAVTEKGGGSTQNSGRVEVVKVKLADGSVDASATVWDKIVDQESNVTLTISLDGTHVFAKAEGEKHATGISTKDLKVTYDAPSELLEEDKRHPGLIGQILTESDEGFTLTSLVDGSQKTFDITQVPVAAIGQYVYVGQRPGVGQDADSLSILDLSTGQSTPLEGSLLGYTSNTGGPAAVEANFSRDYVVYVKPREELAVYKLGEATPLLTRGQDSGKEVPRSAAAYGGYLYCAFEEETGQLTMIDLASGEDASTATGFSGTDVTFVSHFGALESASLHTATKWEDKPSGSGAKPSDGASATAGASGGSAAGGDSASGSANPSDGGSADAGSTASGAASANPGGASADPSEG